MLAQKSDCTDSNILFFIIDDINLNEFSINSYFYENFWICEQFVYKSGTSISNSANMSGR